MNCERDYINKVTKTGMSILVIPVRRYALLNNIHMKIIL